MPKFTATYWKLRMKEMIHVTMTIYEFLVDFVTDDLQMPEIGI